MDIRDLKDLIAHIGGCFIISIYNILFAFTLALPIGLWIIYKEWKILLIYIAYPIVYGLFTWIMEYPDDFDYDDPDDFA